MPDTNHEHIELRTFIERIFDERHRLYQAQIEALRENVLTVVSGQERAVSAAFASSQRAIDKAEAAQISHNAAQNEFRGQLRDQAASLMSRTESLSLHHAHELRMDSIESSTNGRMEAFRIAVEKMTDGLSKEIQGLRESRSESGGRRETQREGDQKHQWSVGVIIAILSALVASAFSLFNFAHGLSQPILPPR